MRIRHIDLAAFGKFTDASIDFGPRDHRVHIVYGPNEAGKSTLLRAIWAFFYGDLRKTKDDYQHAIVNLRIGMSLESASGEVVNWTRRGGGAQSLRDETDRPIVTAEMQKLLADVSEHAFKNQFAINHDQLRHGSEQLYAQKGELGAALFAAASGITSITRVTSELGNEAEAIFTPAGRKKPFNEAVARLTSLKKSLRESSVSTAKYNEVTRLRSEAAQKVQSGQSRRLSCQDRIKFLERVVAGIPKIARLNELNADLASLPPAPALGANFGARRQAAISSRERLRTLIEHGESELKRQHESLSQLRPDPTAIKLLPRLQPLEKHFGSYEKAQADRARLEGEVAKCKRDETEVRRSLQGSHANALAPPRHDLQHFRRRLADYQTRAASLNSLGREVVSIESSFARLEQESVSPQRTADSLPLKSAIEAALRQGAIDEQIVKRSMEVAKLEQQTASELQSLAINLRADDFAAAELPLASRIAECEKRLRRVDQQVEETQRRIRELNNSKEEIGNRLAVLTGDAHVPTEEEVAQARAKRDRLWKEIRVFIDSPPAPTAKAPLLRKLDENLAEQFEAATRGADRLTDRLRTEAHQVAERAKLLGDQAVAVAKLQSAQVELSKIQTEREALLREWREFAATAPTTLKSPAELKEWQPSALRLQDQIRKLANLHADLMHQQNTAAHLTRSIIAAGAALGLKFSGSSLADVLPSAQLQLRDLEADQNRRAAAREEMARLNEQLARSRTEFSITQKECQSIWQELSKSMSDWNWGDVETPSEAERIAPLMEELERLAGEIREKSNRIAGIDRDAADFQHDLSKIAAQMGIATEHIAVAELVAAVSSRLRETQRQHDQSTDLETQCKDVARSLDKDRQALLLAESDLKALMFEAGADSIEALGVIEAQSQRRLDKEAEQRVQESQLAALYEGQTRDAFTAACSATDLSQARAEIIELELQVVEIESQIEVHREDLRTHDAWLRDNQTLEKVASEEFQLQETLSELQMLVRDHVKSRLASEVLLRAMRRYREENQGELLKLGGEIFARLTGGAYRGIRGDVNEEGIAELFAEKSAPPHVPLTQLSDGARDQLYLALRLATLRQHFAHHPPMPFIVDDIFVMFDEGRTLAALEELALLSESTQVIVFTHHAHVVELALSVLGESRCVTHELVQTGRFRTSAQIHQAHKPLVSPTRKRGKKEVAND